MKKLSIGIDSTLENWIKLSEATFGKNSRPTLFLIKKAEEAPNGVNEEVIADEGQLLHALGQMFVSEMENYKK